MIVALLFFIVLILLFGGQRVLSFISSAIAVLILLVVFDVSEIFEQLSSLFENLLLLVLLLAVAAPCCVVAYYVGRNLNEKAEATRLGGPDNALMKDWLGLNKHGKRGLARVLVAGLSADHKYKKSDLAFIVNELDAIGKGWRKKDGFELPFERETISEVFEKIAISEA